MSYISGIVASQAAGFASNIIYFNWQAAELDDMLPKLKNLLGAHYVLAINLRTQGVGGVRGLIEGALGDDTETQIERMKKGLQHAAGGMYATLYDAYHGTTMLLSSYNSVIQNVGINPFINRWVNDEIRPNIPSAEMAWFMHNVGALDDDSYKEYMAQSGWSDTLRQLLEMAWIKPIPIPLILDLKRRELIDINMANDMLKYHGYVGVMNSWISSLAEQMPEPYRAADFAAKGLISDDELYKAFKWYGLSQDWALKWRNSQYQVADTGILFELYWRGVITLETVMAELRIKGIGPDMAKFITSLTELIPPSGDLVTMVVREAWEPENITPAPDIFATYMAKKGFSKDWSDRYWTAHWLPMPIQYGYDNLRRGYWDKDKFMNLLRIADIHPRWREDIYNVAFLPPSIREMGYGYDVGVYTIADIVKYRRWGGLSAEDAAKSGLAMVAYRTEAEREAIRRDYLRLYINDAISREDFETALIAIGTVPEGVPLWLERGDLEIELKSTETSTLEPKNITRSDAQWLFENGLRTETWLRDTLHTLGYLDASIDAYVDQSRKRIADKAKLPVAAEPRKLTLAMVQNLIRIGILDKDEATATVVKLGYTKEDAALIIQIMLTRVYAEPEERVLTDSHITSLYSYNLVSEADILAHFKAENYSDVDARLLTQLAVITKNLPDLTDMYSKGWINQKQLFEGVKALGIPMEVVEPSEFPKLSKLIEVIGLPEEKAKRLMLTIVKAEQPARTIAEKDLTKAEIVKGVKVGVISPVEGVSLLQGLGYDENEAWYILAINKVISAGDPEGYWDMRRVVEAAKKARGEKSVDIPQELIALERQQRELLANLNKLKADKATEIAIGEAAVQLASVEARIHTLIAKLKLT